jgi:hypothetical protein
MMSPDQTEPEESPRPCDFCDEPGTTDDLPEHGECILARDFGDIARILTPEDVSDKLISAEGGMTARQSARAVERLLSCLPVDGVLRGRVTEVSLEERRKMLALIVAKATGDFTRLTELDPELARKIKIETAANLLIGHLLDGDKDEADSPV